MRTIIIGDIHGCNKENHEDYLLKEKLTLKERMIWDKVGKGATVASFKSHGEKMEEAAPWIREHCRMYYKGEGFQCVHAGLLIDPIEANDTETLIHDHGIAMRNCYKGPLTIVGHIALENPTWFAGDEKTAEILPYGEWRELPEKGTLCIDTGCGKGGKLTALVKIQNKYNLICTVVRGFIDNCTDESIGTMRIWSKFGQILLLC